MQPPKGQSSNHSFSGRTSNIHKKWSKHPRSTEHLNTWHPPHSLSAHSYQSKHQISWAALLGLYNPPWCCRWWTVARWKRSRAYTSSKKSKVYPTWYQSYHQHGRNPFQFDFAQFRGSSIDLVWSNTNSSWLMSFRPNYCTIPNK